MMEHGRSFEVEKMYDHVECDQHDNLSCLLTRRMTMTMRWLLWKSDWREGHDQLVRLVDGVIGWETRFESVAEIFC